MKTDIILGGGGSDEKAFATDEWFLRALKGTGRIVYIPVAQEQPSAWSGCGLWFTSMLAKHSAGEAIVLTDLSNPPDVQTVSGIYIGGGDTRILLNRVRESGFEHYLELASKGGVVIFGGSAGAILFGKYLWTAPEARPFCSEPSGLDLLALNWCDELSIACHYQESDDANFLCFSRKNGTVPIIAIPEDVGVIWGTESVRIIGKMLIGYYGGSKQVIPEDVYDKLDFVKAVTQQSFAGS